MSDSSWVVPTARISWEGDSLEALRRFPKGIREEFGAALRKLQTGEMPENVATRPMKSIGKSVFELKDHDERAWYRVIYLSKVEDTIYVLHSFEKDSRKTDQRDLNLAAGRLKKIQERIRDSKREAKKRGKGNGE